MDPQAAMRLEFFTKEEGFPFFVQYGRHDEPLGRHRHEDFSELVVVLKGSAVHLVDQVPYPITKGDVFVINGATEHAFVETDGLRIANLMFRPQLLDTTAADLGRLEGYQALFRVEPALAKGHRFASRLHLGPDEQAQVELALAALVRDYHDRRPGRRTLLWARFLELVVTLARWYEDRPSPEAGSPLRLARAVALLETRFAEDLSVDEVAAEAGLSSRHFSRLFKDSYHLSPLQYLVRLRLRHACTLLDEGRLNITEIARDCGFADSNHFSRQFRQHLGSTPRDYRRALHGGFSAPLGPNRRDKDALRP